MESKFNVFWNFQKKKTGEVMIAEEELQRMLDAAYDAGYNQSIADHNIPLYNPKPFPSEPTSSGQSSNIPGWGSRQNSSGNPKITWKTKC